MCEFCIISIKCENIPSSPLEGEIVAWYLSARGFMLFKPTKAPFLNCKRYFPLVVAPSGLMTNWGSFPCLTISYLSAICSSYLVNSRKYHCFLLSTWSTSPNEQGLDSLSNDSYQGKFLDLFLWNKCRQAPPHKSKYILKELKSNLVRSSWCDCRQELFLLHT